MVKSYAVVALLLLPTMYVVCRQLPDCFSTSTERHNSYYSVRSDAITNCRMMLLPVVVCLVELHKPRNLRSLLLISRYRVLHIILGRCDDVATLSHHTRSYTNGGHPISTYLHAKGLPFPLMPMHSPPPAKICACRGLVDTTAVLNLSA